MSGIRDAARPRDQIIDDPFIRPDRDTEHAGGPPVTPEDRHCEDDRRPATKTLGRRNVSPAPGKGIANVWLGAHKVGERPGAAILRPYDRAARIQEERACDQRTRLNECVLEQLSASGQIGVRGADPCRQCGELIELRLDLRVDEPRGRCGEARPLPDRPLPAVPGERRSEKSEEREDHGESQQDERADAPPKREP